MQEYKPCTSCNGLGYKIEYGKRICSLKYTGYPCENNKECKKCEYFKTTLDHYSCKECKGTGKITWIDSLFNKEC